MRDAILEKVFEKRRAVSDIARSLGLTPSALSQWTRVPAGHVLAVQHLTGIPRSQLRPDLYPPGDDRHQHG